MDERKKYVWDVNESALREKENGNIGADEIKIMRLMMTSEINLIIKIRGISEKCKDINMIAKIINKF